jgi:hypothetical protein
MNRMHRSVAGEWKRDPVQPCISGDYFHPGRRLRSRRQAIPVDAAPPVGHLIRHRLRVGFICALTQTPVGDKAMIF